MEKVISWNDGTEDKITVSAPEFEGNQTLSIESDPNLGQEDRSKTMQLVSKNDPSKQASIQLTQTTGVNSITSGDASLNISPSQGNVEASVNLSKEAGNNITLKEDGLYVPKSGFQSGMDETLGVSYCYLGTDPKSVTITLPDELVDIIGSGESTVSAIQYALSLQSTAYFSLNTSLIVDAYETVRDMTIDRISSEINKLVFADAVTKLTPLEFYMVIPTASSKVLDTFFHLKGVPNYNEISIESNWSSITLGMETGTPYAVVDMGDGAIAAKNFRTRYIQSTSDIPSAFGEGKKLYYRYLGKDPALVKVPIPGGSFGLEFFAAYLTATFSSTLLGNLDASNLSYVIDQTNTTLLSSITDGSNFITKLCKGMDFYVEPINQMLSDSVIPIHDIYVKYSDGVGLLSEGSLPANLSKESLIIEIPNFISFIIRYDSTDSKVKITDYILLGSNKTSKNIWTGSQSEYDGLQTKDQNTIYIITK